MAYPTELSSSTTSVQSWAIHTARSHAGQTKPCDNCARQKWAFSWCHAFFFLVVDIVTILLVLRFNLHHQGGDGGRGLGVLQWKSTNGSEVAGDIMGRVGGAHTNYDDEAGGGEVGGDIMGRVAGDDEAGGGEVGGGHNGMGSDDSTAKVDGSNNGMVSDNDTAKLGDVDNRVNGGDIKERVGGGDTEGSVNVVDVKDDSRTSRGRSLDIIPNVSPVLVLLEELNSTRQTLEDMLHRPSFSCHRISDQPIETVVKYSECAVTTEGINPETGKFTVMNEGIYQISFTGYFYVHRGHLVACDIKVIRNGSSVSEAVIIGSSSAKVIEDTRKGVFGEEYKGKDDTIIVTLTVAVFEKLYSGDQIYVWNYMAEKMDGEHGLTQLKSDFSRKIHFTARKVSDLPPPPPPPT